MEGLDVIRVGPEFSKGDELTVKGFEYFFQFFSFSLAGIINRKADAIMCCCPPLPIAIASILLGRLKRAPVIVRIGDLHPQELVDLGLIKSRSLIRLLELMERFVYAKSDYLTVLSEGYRQHLLSKGADGFKIRVLPNWGDIAELDALGKSIALSEYKGKFVVTYAGMISWFQDLETLVDAASLLRANTNIHFLIVGDGPEKRRLEEKARILGLQNVTFMPLQPRVDYLRILQGSDVCVVAIKKEVKTTTIPSKLFDIMVCSRPVLAIAPTGEISDIISNSKCGSWVEPQNPQKVAGAILSLYQNSSNTEESGRNGRRYLEAHFTLDNISKQHEEIMCQLANRGIKIVRARLWKSDSRPKFVSKT
jgi:glycosyltransferase involved in cell wall biosynthesis